VKHLGDIKSKRLIHIKGWLFFVLALIAVVGLLVPNFSWHNLALLAIAIWAASRWYYYLFYVIEHYVDSEFKFSSVTAAISYLLRHKSL
jgi:hypothetical protein